MPQPAHFWVADKEDIARPVIAYAHDYPVGAVIDWHAHRRLQLIHAVSGVMTVQTGGGMWLVPPGRAMWMPGGQDHAIRADGALSMRSLFIEPDALPHLAGESCVVDVPPLVRELILACLDMPLLYDTGGPDGRLVATLFDRIARLPGAGMHLPLPTDRRLRYVTDAVLADPADHTTLEQWGRRVGASGRTLARLMRRETGMTFAAWRRQAALQRALVWLTAGRPVTTIAFDLGYDSPSAFIAMFKKAFGTTPGAYLSAPSDRGGA